MDEHIVTPTLVQCRHYMQISEQHAYVAVPHTFN